MLTLLLLFSAITATPQADYQLFALSPFRLDFSGHQIQEARFQGTKRSADPPLGLKGAQVLLLLPQNHSSALNLTESLGIDAPSTPANPIQQEPTTIHPKVVHLKEKADEIVIERAEKQKEKYNFNGRWEENLPDGSGDEPEAVTQDSVIEVNGVKGIDDVESEPLTKKDTTTIPSLFTKKPESLPIAKKSSKLSSLNEIISKKFNENGRVKELSESLDEVIDEIEKKGEEKMEGKKKKEEKEEKDEEELKKFDLNQLKEAKIDKKTEIIEEKTKKTIEAKDSIPVPEKIVNPIEEIQSTTKKVVDGGLEESAEKTEETTTPPKLFKQIWPTEVVIEGREFYLVPKNGRARDYLEPYSGGGYFLKKSPQDWFRGLHEQLRSESRQE